MTVKNNQLPSRPEPSHFKTVDDVLNIVRDEPDTIPDNPWYVKANRICGGKLPPVALLFCAWELFYGEPAVIARLRTLRAMDMS